MPTMPVAQTAVPPKPAAQPTKTPTRAKQPAASPTVPPTVPPTAPPSPTPSPQSPPATRLTLGAVTPHWREMLSRVEQVNRNLPALLTMGKPLATEGNTIILGFDFPIFKDKFDQNHDAVPVLSDIFSQLLGTKCLVRAVVTSEYTIPIQKEEFDALAQELGGVVRKE